MVEQLDIGERPFAGDGRGLELFCLVAAIAWIYYYTNPEPQTFYDYPFRVADSILGGSIGLAYHPPSWLNEFVPFGDRWYSVFPLGSVLTMLPFAALKRAGLISEMPARELSASIAAGIGFFLFRISTRYELNRAKQIALVVVFVFGTWMWTNLTFGGAWQLSLGFAMLGELGALWYVVFRRRPWLAGLFFALAFGNRTEVLVSAPVFMWLLSRDCGTTAAIRRIAVFSVAPFILGVATLVYNYVRFDSIADFGHSRIPGVLAEPWYEHGIFSVLYVGNNFVEMLVRPWAVTNEFPYLVPGGFGSAIIWSSPFLFLLFRLGARDRGLKYASWVAVALMTSVLWIHGNSGGWQFGYRYAMILLPWMFVILLENGPRKLSTSEWPLFVFSLAANAIATWLFFYTQFVTP